MITNETTGTDRQSSSTWENSIDVTAVDECSSIKSLQRNRLRKYLVLVLICMIPFAVYYVYDIPGALNEQIRNWFNNDFDEWQVKFNALYSVYSLPNLVMPIVSGILVDSIGANRMMVFLSALVCIGQLIISLGIQFKIYPLLSVGRILLGLGGESLEVAQARLIVDIFSNENTGFALGLNLTFARIASSLNDWISPWIDENFSNPTIASWLGLFVCIFSLFCLFGAILLNPYNKFGNENEEIKGEEEEFLMEDSISTNKPPILENSEPSQVEIFRWTSFRSLPVLFFLLCAAIIFLYGSVNPFIHILSAFLQKKYNLSERSSGAYMSIPDLVSAIGSPLFGFILDHFASKYRSNINLRHVMLPMSGVLLVCSHIIFGFTNIQPLIPLFIVGLAYSLFGAVLWPLVPELIENNRLLGTAYGFSSVALNIALSTVPLLVAWIVPVHGYMGAEIFFLCLGCVGTLLGIVIILINLQKKTQYTLLLENEVECDV